MEKILQVIGGMNRRGAESFIMNVYRKIDRNKVQFDFLVYSDKKQDFEDEIISLGGRVIHINISSIKIINNIKKIRNVIEEFGPYKAIHAQTLHNIGIVWEAAKHYPEILRIAHSHSTHNKKKSSLLLFIYEMWTKFIIKKYTHIMLACGYEAGIYLFGERFKKDGIIIKNAIDIYLFNKENSEEIDKIRSDLNIKDELVIGSIARFSDVKNHPFMLKIAMYLKINKINFCMLFIGDGEERNNIYQKVNKLGLNNEIKFLGVRNDINNLMHVIDVLLMPSFWEGNPVTLIEAQAAGLPCVISDSIPNENDFDLNLVYKCSLNSPIDEWVKTIIESSKHRCLDNDLIFNKLTNNGLNINDLANKLLNIYLS